MSIKKARAVVIGAGGQREQRAGDHRNEGGQGLRGEKENVWLSRQDRKKNILYLRKGYMSRGGIPAPSQGRAKMFANILARIGKKCAKERRGERVAMGHH